MVGTPLAELLRAVREQAGPAQPADRSAPFLTVLTRTQGQRLAMLREALLCLAAQTCDDFEVLLLAHDVPVEHQPEIHGLVDELPAYLRERVRVVPVEGGGRAQPLRTGIAAAAGRYVGFLDDDDLVLAHWVETFHTLAEANAGAVLRAVVAEQDVERASWSGRDGYLPRSATRSPYPSEFVIFTHLGDNFSPLCGLAYPRSALTELGIAFDDTLPVLEDWDVLLQAAAWCGVAATSAVTSVYRRWIGGGSAHDVHPIETWRAAEMQIMRRLDARPLLLPPGSVSWLRANLAEHHRLYNEVAALRAEVQAARDDADHSRAFVA